MALVSFRLPVKDTTSAGQIKWINCYGCGVIHPYTYGLGRSPIGLLTPHLYTQRSI